MELRIIKVCLSRSDKSEAEARKRVEERKAQLDEEWRKHVEQLRELLQFKELPGEEDFAQLPVERQTQLLSAEIGFLEIAKVTFMIRKGPAAFGGLG